MRSPLIIFFTLLAFAVSVQAVSIDPKVLTDLQDSNEVSVIVMLEKNADMNNIPGTIEKENEYDALNGFSGRISRQELGELLSEPGVSSVQLDEPIRAALADSGPLTNASLVWPVKINGINITGASETVCVIDTGADYNHTWLGSGWGNKVIGGYDFVNGDTDPYDDNGHGTYTAGIIASNNTTYRGLAPDANIVAIKALDSNGSGFESDVIAGINWCVANATQFNISVISMSVEGSTLFSGNCDSSKASFRNAINTATEKNISVIASSGNSGSTSNMPAPACIQNATSVGSTTKTDGISSFSNRNNVTDLFAPGSSITSLVPTGSCSLCASSGFGTFSGTSASAPHVSAAFALLRQYKRLENGTILNPAQIESALKASGLNISDSGANLTFQRINIFRALVYFDATKPLLAVSSPSNITYNTTNISLAYSASDNVARDVCRFTNTTGSASALSGCSNITFLAVANQQNNITLVVNDSNGNANSSQVFFFIDTIYPSLNVSSPQNLTYKTDNLTLSFLASDSNKVDRCWYVNTTGSSIFLNDPRGACSNITFISKEGVSNITVYANDTGGNANSSSIFFTTNLSFILAVQLPANTTYSSANVSVNYTISGFDACWLTNATGGRVDMPGCTNTSITGAPNALNNITIFVNNSDGGVNSSQIFFTIDTLAPSVNFTSPTPNNQTLNANDVTINVTLGEDASAVLLEWGGANYTMNGSLSRSYSFFELDDGNYTFRVFANDSLGNGNFTAFRWAYVNATRNLSSFISSLNSSLVSNSVSLLLLNNTGSGDASRIFVDINYTLKFNITGIIAEVANFSFLNANTSNLLSVTRNISLINISTTYSSGGGALDNYIWVDINNFTENYTPSVTFPGTFRLNFYLNGSRESPASARINESCNADFSNTPCQIIANQTTIRLASFSGASVGNDTQAPSITISSPSGTQTGSNISLSYSASDNVGLDRCWYSLNSGTNVTPSGCSNTTFAPASGTNTLVVYANDTSGNSNSSSATFTYSPAPAASSSGGGGGGGGGSSAPAPQNYFRRSWNVAGKPVSSNISIGSLPVKSITIFVSSETRNPSITISPEKTGPVELLNAYQYFSINSTFPNSSLDRVEITFAVNRSWLAFNEYDKTRTKLNRFDNGWLQLPTEIASENDSHVVYKSTIPRFSYFVITGEKTPAAPVEEPEQEKPVCIQVITPAVKGSECINYPTPCDVPAGWTVVESCNEQEIKMNAEKPGTGVAFLLVSGIVVLLAIVLIYKSVIKKKSRTKTHIHSSSH